MKAVVYDGELRVADVDVPQAGPSEALIRVTMAGICNTDIEITRRYVPGFGGIPGHEFVGVVADAPAGTVPAGARVTAEINCSCGGCGFCRAGLHRHCPSRSVIGITGRQGAFAEYIAVPAANVHRIPDSVPDTTAVFIEPLAAALRILDQVDMGSADLVCVLGDGKLGQCIARVCAATGCALTVVGKHERTLALCAETGAETVLLEKYLQRKSRYDIIIEATGTAQGIGHALAHVRPCGTVVLKSTYAGPGGSNLSPAVVDEITVVGSRCGDFPKAIAFMLEHDLSLEKLISARYPLDRAGEAFAHSQRPGALKILLTNT